MKGQPIQFEHVSRLYGSGKQTIRAVDDVSFTIEPGQTLCLVGESGCGKSTTGRMVAGLIEPSEGRVLYGGKDVSRLSEAEAKRYRRAVQIIHQDPYASLNPTRSVAQILSDPLLHHKMVKSRAELNNRLEELLQIVGLTPPADFLRKYPHQLSGGQRQRVSVARALTVDPEFIVADEPVSSVDVSLRVSLLNMLLKLQREQGVTFLFITHDLAVAKHFAWDGRIGVMYLGRMVELASTPKLIGDPVHPYTRALIAALPEADPQVTRNKERLRLRSADIPSLLNLPPGCTFHPRCPLYEEGLCEKERPAEDVVDRDGHLAACFVMARELGQVERIPSALQAEARRVEQGVL
ncbi:MAG TPA: oligopeptide/dipeptide ABC transporter ATP-binding protein [Herpetosiphonaceae bacterium]|nr:oligopeptide/dipeptide ABC transporter ATP-binding protein [Herpetosiphonaceae bacterium]